MKNYTDFLNSVRKIIPSLSWEIGDTTSEKYHVCEAITQYFEYQIYYDISDSIYHLIIENMKGDTGNIFHEHGKDLKKLLNMWITYIQDIFNDVEKLK